MRHVLLSCVILLLALSFCLFSMLHIRAICKEALDVLALAQKSAEESDFEACRVYTARAMRHWQRYERYFGLVLAHEEVDDVLGRFAALTQYAQLEDRDDFLAGVAELRFSISHLREMELPALENIL